MYNPWICGVGGCLSPVTGKKQGNMFDGVLKRLRRLDEDDILLLVILFFLMKNGEQERQWPLLAAMIYCML